MSEGDALKREVANGKIYDLEEVKKHTREDDCWLVVDGDVFDVTDFLDEHPGGFDIIISNTGTLSKTTSLLSSSTSIGCVFHKM